MLFSFFSWFSKFFPSSFSTCKFISIGLGSRCYTWKGSIWWRWRRPSSRINIFLEYIAKGGENLVNCWILFWMLLWPFRDIYCISAFTVFDLNFTIETCIWLGLSYIMFPGNIAASGLLVDWVGGFRSMLVVSGEGSKSALVNIIRYWVKSHWL